jgi:isocitrate dehydrogenase (NAD+)
MSTVTVIEGDGIGPEVISAARQCLEALNGDIAFRSAPMGQAAIDEYGTPLPAETVDAVRDADAALKGPVKTPVGSGFRSVNVELRKRLELYANIRPCRYIPGVGSRITDAEDIDIVVVRENLEDVYAGIEFEQGTTHADDLRTFLDDRGHATRADSGYSIKPISRSGSERIIRHAFEYAETRGYDSVTAVDKANIMKYTDGLFMDVAGTVADDYDVAYDHVLVDNMAQQLVMHPEEFGVVVSQNLYGDILSDLTAGLVGGVGMIPSANIGDEAAVFASVHGTAPDIAGENRANPAAVILSAAMLLDHLGEAADATRLREAVRAVVAAGDHVTADLGGDASTETMTAAIIDRL